MNAVPPTGAPPTVEPAPSERSDLAGRVFELLPRERSVHFGIEVATDSLTVHQRPLVPDDRCAAAALFGFEAPAHWHLTGTVLVGRSRRIDTAGPGATVDDDVSAVVLVERNGNIESTVEVGGTATQPPPTDGAEPQHELIAARTGPHGLIVDALLRTFGLPSAGEAPPPAHLGLALWARLIAEEVGAGRPVPWRRIVELHPASPVHPWARPLPTTSTLSATLVEQATDVSWERMHRRATSGQSPLPGLTAREAAWMDPTLYARWILGWLPNPMAVSELVTRHDVLAGRRLAEVIDLVVAAADRSAR